jgi:hypothetical protein
MVAQEAHRPTAVRSSPVVEVVPVVADSIRVVVEVVPVAVAEPIRVVVEVVPVAVTGPSPVVVTWRPA